MKLRNGFVSNSSSSSFIVHFPHEPKSVDDVREMLFGEEKTFLNRYPWGTSTNPTDWDVNVVSERVFRDLKDKKPDRTDPTIEYFNQLAFCKMYERDVELWDKENWWEVDYEARIMCAEWIRDNPDHVVYRLGYSNQNGEFDSNLEHGNLFKRLPHIRISHH